ncbi:MAG: hypothetical protein ACI9U6_000398 [Loktanella salsilacus]|jgi:hypothetical protein
MVPLKVASASVPEHRVMLYVGEMRITSAKIASVSPCRYRLNSEIEHQTRKDTTTGPARPEGQRGAIKADTRPDELESRGRAQDNYEQISDRRRRTSPSRSPAAHCGQETAIIGCRTTWCHAGLDDLAANTQCSQKGR